MSTYNVLNKAMDMISPYAQQDQNRKLMPTYM